MDLHTGAPDRSPWSHGDPWPVNWSGVWVGALAALAAALVLGLTGMALGFHLIGPSQRVTDLKTLHTATVVWSILSAFFAFVAGGWVTARVAGLYYSEPAMLHGAVSWLVAVPLLLLGAALGGASYMGSWYGGLAGTPAWAAQATPAVVTAAPGDREVPQDPATQEAARVARNSALMAVTVLLLGLMGSVLGAWLACGEPIHTAYERAASGLSNQAAAGRPTQYTS